LEYYGINCKAGDLIKTYLNDRYPKVIIKNGYSETALMGTIKQDIPQG